MFEQETVPEGDQERDEFVRDNFTKVAWSLVAMGATPEQAFDATQDAMIVTYQKWPQLTSPHAFVRLCARRAFLGMARRVTAERRAEQRLEVLSSGSMAPAADEKVVFDDEAQQVLDMLATLATRQRQVIVHTMDGLSIEEIAGLIGQPTATVRSNLRHARNKLKQMIYDRRE